MQSRRLSLIEAMTSTAIGFVIALIATVLVLPLFGFPTSFGQSLGITAIYTVISVMRGYLVRRMFVRGAPQGQVLAEQVQCQCHYHVDQGGISVYVAGELAARINMNSEQLVGFAIDALRASREVRPQINRAICARYKREFL